MHSSAGTSRDDSQYEADEKQRLISYSKRVRDMDGRDGQRKSSLKL